MLKNILVLSKGQTLENALKLLDENGDGILPVVDANNKFVGIITDGDVRRGLLNNSFKLNKIINKNPYTIQDTATKEQKIQFLKKIHRRHLPILNQNNELVDIFLLDDIEFNIKDNVVVIMAGGLGTRLGDLTKTTPKPMLKVGKKPILERIIEAFIQQGFNKFYISVNYMSNVIKDYFGDGSKYGVRIDYLEEKKRLGTGGSLRLIKELPKKPLIVMNGDVLTSISFDDLLDFHNKNNSLATMCLREYENKIAYGVVELNQDDNKIKSIIEKPSYTFKINAGIYVINPEIIHLIPRDEYYDLPDLFKSLSLNSETSQVYGYDIEDYWLDIGTYVDYQKANSDYHI